MNLFDNTRACTLEEQLIADALVNRMMIMAITNVLLKTGKFTQYDIRAFKESVEDQINERPVDFDEESLTGQEFHPLDVPAIKARASYLIDTIFAGLTK